MTKAKHLKTILAVLAALFCLNASANNGDSLLQRQYRNFKNSTQPTLALKQASELQEQMEEQDETNYAPLYPYLGAAYESRGNYRMARYYYEKAYDSLEGDQPVLRMDIYARMARLLMLRNPVEARHWNDKLFELCRNRSAEYQQVAYFVSGMICFAVGNSYDFEHAYMDYQEHRKQHNTLDNYGEELMEMVQLAFEGKYEEAMQMLSQASTIAGADQVALTDMRIQLCNMQKRPDLALEWAKHRSEQVDSLNADMQHSNMNQINAAAGLGQAQARAAKAHERLLRWVLALTLIICAIMGGSMWYVRNKRSQLKERNKQLLDALAMAEEGQKMKTEFVRSVSHEIRTPLNAISGFNDLLNTPGLELPDEERADLVGRIKDNVKAITKIVDDMLQMADKESNEFNTESGHIYCNQFLGNILYAHRSKVSANIELSYTTDVINRFQITTSKDGLRKILEQLIENAIKFTQRGTINVHCKQSEDQKTVLISVTDTGKGIAPENQEKVFEGFYKENSFEQGIGLGLALSKKIAQKMGGDLVLDTEYTNGCKFILSLPIEN